MGKEFGIEGSGRATIPAPFEVKDLGGPMGTIGFTPDEKRGAEGRRDCHWLCVVTDCDAQPRLHVRRDPVSLPCHEATKVAHCCLSVNALTEIMRASEERPEYGGQR